ncbi:restriction endonuclease subunit S [Microcella alkaliphila]|uniref:Type I restriction-modification system n=1 Tax=Microcella alkaliphila TaxID=279828 RepID=A0A0U5BCT7_9MICO|nr:restriction endonuclease subunit S [Microcella alkaliphila]BAU32063.1 type I restriction-modification system [Microcella alkaliphila]
MPQAEYMALTGNKVVLNLSGADNMRHVEPGDYISHLRSFQGGLEYSAYEGKVSAAYTVLTPRKEVDPHYFRFLFKSTHYVQGLQTTTDQMRDGQSIRYGQFALLPLPYPPLAEQRRIAEFLDRETAQIDELIAKQEQLISTLAERRTSVILNGVARGFSGVELKDSEADWLGKVPAHWQIRRLKYSVRFSKNGVWGDEPDGGESDVWVIRVADFDRVRRTVTKDKQTYRKVSYSDRNGRLLLPGDLLLEKSGGGEKSPVGFVAIYEDAEPALTSNFVARLQVESDCDSRYWLYVHAALYASRVTERSIKQTSGIQNLDQSSYFNELAPFPPLEEQRSIANEIDARLDAILAAGRKAELLIDRLRERRQALISAAVTGQIDVGGAS